MKRRNPEKQRKHHSRKMEIQAHETKSFNIVVYVKTLNLQSAPPTDLRDLELKLCWRFLFVLMTRFRTKVVLIFLLSILNLVYKLQYKSDIQVCALKFKCSTWLGLFQYFRLELGMLLASTFP